MAVPPLGRDNPSLADRVAALQETVEAVGGPVIIVAHSAGVITTVHWAARHPGSAGLDAGRAAGHPAGPGVSRCPRSTRRWPALTEHGWLPIPRERLPFPSIVAASSNDSLGDPDAGPGAGRRLGQPVARPRRGGPSQPRFRLRRLAASRSVYQETQHHGGTR